MTLNRSDRNQAINVRTELWVAVVTTARFAAQHLVPFVRGQRLSRCRSGSRSRRFAERIREWLDLPARQKNEVGALEVTDAWYIPLGNIFQYLASDLGV